MDINKEYITMCEKARDIQKNWIPNFGDFYFDKECSWRPINNVMNGDAGDKPCPQGYYDDPKIWDTLVFLPRQDQLQEMVGNKKPDELIVRLINYLQDNQKYYKDGTIKKLYPTSSMEQLWLVFVMKEQYNKQWSTGKQDWIAYDL